MLHEMTQSELFEKFNLAFYEGQNLSKENDFLDFLINDPSPVPTPREDLSFFDFDELESSFNSDFDLDIDFYDGFSESSIDLDSIASNLQDLEPLPSVSTITNVNFNNYLRSLPEDTLTIENSSSKSEFGHLIGLDNEFLENFDENQIVITQDEILEDSFFEHNSETSYDEETSPVLQCQWENCYQIYDGQSALVKHIEKIHVEVKRGDEFTCFWMNCPRKIKPFNARYKLLIHMRVHSGEKPNKCPFESCNKAFSRLENLKIHQRSHTGERPYLCQFPTCSKSFSNSSDRAKHQRTHFDTKPYACQVVGCSKKYTDPSSLRKHVKNHSSEEQMLLKKKSGEDCYSANYVRKFFDPARQKAVKSPEKGFQNEHNYSNFVVERKFSCDIRQDLKNKISEKSRLRKVSF